MKVVKKVVLFFLFIIIYTYTYKYIYIYIYIYHHILSPQWLCGNSCSWLMDEWLHIAHTMEPENAQQAKEGVSIKGLLADDSCKRSKDSAFKKKGKRCI